jgi:hypothetical protein
VIYLFNGSCFCIGVVLVVVVLDLCSHYLTQFGALEHRSGAHTLDGIPLCSQCHCASWWNIDLEYHVFSFVLSVVRLDSCSISL